MRTRNRADRADRVGLFGVDLPSFVTEPFDAVADVVSSGWERVPGHEIIDDATAPAGAVTKWWWDTFKYTNIYFGPYVWFGETSKQIADDIADGKPVGGAIGQALTDKGKAYARSLQQAAPYIAMVPGVGTGIAIAMNAAAAIALGQPVDKMALDTVALSIPGGAAAQSGFRSGAEFGSGIAQGKRLDEAALQAARAALPSEEARIAFDAGLALARGKSLQDAGFQALYYFTKGNTLAERAAHFSEALVTAARQGRSVGDVLAQGLQQDVAKLGGSFTENMKRVEDTANRLRAIPNYVRLSPEEVGQMAGVPPEIARAAMAAVTWDQVGTPRVDEGTLQNIDPVRANLRPKAPVALRNTKRLAPLIHNVRAPAWLVQKDASIADYEPPRVLPPVAATGAGQQGASKIGSYVVAPLLLTAPLWLPTLTDWWRNR